MKVQNISNYMNYKTSAKPIKNEEVSRAKNCDVIEIKGMNSRDKEAVKLDSIKKNVVSQVNNETNAEKINKIKESINNKTYRVDVEEIINKLL